MFAQSTLRHTILQFPYKLFTTIDCRLIHSWNNISALMVDLPIIRKPESSKVLNERPFSVTRVMHPSNTCCLLIKTSMVVSNFLLLRAGGRWVLLFCHFKGTIIRKSRNHKIWRVHYYNQLRRAHYQNKT